MEKEIQEKKTFSYMVDNVTLTFTLRVDIRDEMIIFYKMLDEAQNDIKKEIDKIK